jgi:hypothetical protein
MVPSTSSSSLPQTPTTSSSSFVNYTPDDARKILTGVAPSGSSKTKARREKEAAEKQARYEEQDMERRRRISKSLDQIKPESETVEENIDIIKRLVEEKIAM